MDDRVDTIISATIDQWEGDFVDHPADRGGPTNYGITAATYAAWLGRPVITAEVRSMPRAHAVAIYRQRYWRTAGIDRLPESLWPVVFDISVNMGPVVAIKFLQRAVAVSLAVRLADDGQLGPNTLEMLATALDKVGTTTLVNAICDQRARRYDEIIDRDPSQKVFRKGWLRRCEAFRIRKKGG